VLVVTRLDRLARSTRDLLNVLAAVGDRGAGFNASNAACRQWLSYFGISTVNGYHRHRGCIPQSLRWRVHDVRTGESQAADLGYVVVGFSRFEKLDIKS
jgi:Resolvase, N terminal domain